MSFIDRIAAAVTPAASDEARAKARREAIELGAREPWLATIIDHHVEIERLISELLAMDDSERRRTSLRQLATLLTAHANAEETVIYPDVVEFSGKSHGAMAYEEHAMTKVNMAMLEKLHPSSPEWREKLEHIRGALQQHMYQEEHGWLPDLVKNLPSSEKERMARRFREEFDSYARAGYSGTRDGPAIHEVQAMPHDGLKGAPDGVNTQGEDKTPPALERKSDDGGFGGGFLEHGGQSQMGYHGSGQLGDQEVKPGGNQNSGTRKA